MNSVPPVPQLPDLSDDDLIDAIAMHNLQERRGRKPASAVATAQALPTVEMSYLRDITPEDLRVLETAPLGEVSLLSQLRHSHHELARLVASGMSFAEIAATTGRTAGTIARLANTDPMFRELVLQYGDIAKEKYVDAHAALGTLGLTVVGMLQEKLENKDAKDFTTKELRDIGEFALDRSIAPPKGTKGAAGGNAAPMNINISFVTPPKITEEAAPQVIDVTPNKGPNE